MGSRDETRRGGLNESLNGFGVMKRSGRDEEGQGQDGKDRQDRQDRFGGRRRGLSVKDLLSS